MKIFLILLALIPMSLSGNICATDNDKISSIDNANEQQYQYSIDDTGFLKCINPTVVINGDKETFTFESSEEIITVENTGNAILKNYTVNNKILNCTLLIKEDICEFNLIINRNMESERLYSLYFCKGSDEKIYSSAISLDTAKTSAGVELDYGFTEYIEEQPFDNNKAKAFGANSNSGTVYGYLHWTDDQGKIHPLAGVMARLITNVSQWNYFTYTDSTGYYTISISQNWQELWNYSPKLMICAQGRNIGVSTPNNPSNIYCKTIDVVQLKPTTTECSYIFKPDADGDMGKAINILQAGIYFSEYAKSLNNNTALKSCYFYYPYKDPQGKLNSFYDRNNHIYINSERKNAACPNTYACWDVIGHEYGHHVQNCFGIEENPGGSHNIPGNAIDDQYKMVDKNGNKMYSLEESKERGIKLAWAEGYATYWSTVAQLSFPEDIKNIDTVGDTVYTSSNGLIYEINEYPTIGYGEADEQSITRILFKLNSAQQDEYDKFSISDVDLWQIVVQNKVKMLYTFIDALYKEGYSKNNLGLLLGKYNVSAFLISSDNYTYNTPPSFRWSAMYGSSNLNYNEFDFIVMRPDGEIILRKNGIKSSSFMCTYKLTSAEWSLILSNNDTSFSVCVVSKQTTGFSSGFYYSKYFSFDKP